MTVLWRTLQLCAFRVVTLACYKPFALVSTHSAALFRPFPGRSESGGDKHQLLPTIWSLFFCSTVKEVEAQKSDMAKRREGGSLQEKLGSEARGVSCLRVLCEGPRDDISAGDSAGWGDQPNKLP